MSRVICLGYFDRGNCGDEAFKKAHHWFFGEENVVLRNGPLKAEEIQGRPVVLGGGDVVAPFFLNWIPAGVPFDMVGVGLKYEQSSINAIKSKGDAFGYSWFRNHIDVDLCREAGVASDYIPDIVFALRDLYDHEPSELTRSLVPNTGKPKLGVCLSDHFNSREDHRDPKHAAYLEYYKWELASTFDKLAKDYHIVFIPFSVYANHMDHRLHYDVVRRMHTKSQVTLVSAELDPLHMLNLIRQMEYVASMKLHGNIFGLVTKRKCINIGVGRKQQKLYEESDLGEVSLDPYSFTKDRFIRAFGEASKPSVAAKIDKLADTSFDALVAFRRTIRERYNLPPVN